MAVVVALAFALVPAGVAQAFTVTINRAAPDDPTAGAHSNFTLDLAFDGPLPNDPGTQPRDLIIDLPAGLIGNANATTKCSLAAFNANQCDASQQVGTTTVATKGLGFIDVPAEGIVYNLASAGNEPARLGIKLTPIIPLGQGIPIPIPIRQESPITVRTEGDYGLRSAVSGLPNDYLIPGIVRLDVKTLSLTLFGRLGNGRAFMSNPTKCVPAVTRVTATAYSNETATAEASFTPTNCGSVPFDPTLSVTPDNQQRDAPAGYTAKINLPEGEDRAQAHIENAQVALPEGTVLSAAVASNGLEGCSDEQFGKGGNAPVTCPAGSQIGTVSFTSPPVGTLPGRVYLGLSAPGQLLRIFILAEASGAPDALRVKLVADVNPDARTGQVFTKLTNLPPVPITDFTLSFRGGDNAVLANPLLCGSYTGVAELAPDSGNAAKSPAGSFAIDAPDCPNPAPFGPAAQGQAQPTTAGGDTAFTLTVSRDTGTDRLSSLKATLPQGLLGRIASVFPCPPEDAAAGACDDRSLLGTARVLVGPGNAPQPIEGKVYLVRRLTALNVDKGGPVGALAVTLPGKVGPLDLGTVVSVAELRLIGGQVVVEAEGLPTILQGIPLNLRSLALTLNRPGFQFNATGCDQRQVKVQFGSVGRQSASAQTPYQATDCDKLPFTPKLTARIGGRNNVANHSHPGLRTAILQDPGEANVGKVEVKLPPGIAPDPTRLSRACPEATLAAGKCPKSSIIGTAQATTTLLPLPIAGLVRFVTPPGGGLPEVDVDLRGVVNLQLRGKTALGADGFVTTTFEGVPDVPLSRFELAFSPGGVLLATKDLCAAPTTLNATLTSQNGVAVPISTRPVVDGCGVSGPRAAIRLGKVGSSPSLDARVVGDGKRMRSVSITLPSGLTVGNRRGSVRRTPAKSKVALSKRRIRVRLPGSGARTARVRIPSGVLSASPKLRRAATKTVRFSVTVDFAKGQGKTRTFRVRTAVRH